MTLPDDLFTNVEGFISLPEAELLHALACAVPAGSLILEIGAYRGRSTCALALGAKEAGATVYSIDSHPSYEAGGTYYGMADNQAYYANLAHYGVGDVVKTINLPSDTVWPKWYEPIALLWIDGSHEYNQVERDFGLWSSMTDVVAMHDTSGHFEDVTRVVNEILQEGIWERVKIVDSLSIFKRVAK